MVAHHPLCVLLEAKLRGKGQKLVPAAPSARTLRGLELLVTPQDPPAFVGTGPYRCVSFLRTSSLTRNVHGKSFLKN